jgi:FkbM family methyltransferase
MIPPPYLYKKNTLRTVTRNNINFNLNIGHVVDHYLFWGLEYENFNSIQKELKKADGILDIGANIGVTTLYFASLNPNTKIIAFEPHPKNYACLQENIQLNKFQNIETIQAGLGAKEQDLKLYEIDKNNPGNNRILKKEIDAPSVDIHIFNLDEFLSTKERFNIDFIKIDVEGYEYAVLLGAEKTLKQHSPLLFVELDDNYLITQGKSTKMVLELLISYGYTNFKRADSLEIITLETNFSNCHFDLIAN